jgi:hypothetical protein
MANKMYVTIKDYNEFVLKIIGETVAFSFVEGSKQITWRCTDGYMMKEGILNGTSPALASDILTVKGSALNEVFKGAPYDYVVSHDKIEIEITKLNTLRIDFNDCRLTLPDISKIGSDNKGQ